MHVCIFRAVPSSMSWLTKAVVVLVLPMTLEAFLILPVQRLPRYILLLERMLENTWAGHPDENGLLKPLLTASSTVVVK